MFDGLLTFISNLLFLIGNFIMGATLIIGLIVAILLGIEAKFGIFETRAYTILRFYKKLGKIAIAGIVISIVFYVLGLIVEPNHL